MKNRRLRWLKVEALVTDRVIAGADPKALRESVYGHDPGYDMTPATT